MYTDKNDRVFDPFAGTASLGVACLLLDRHFVGLEIDGNLQRSAQKRLVSLQKSIEKNGTRKSCVTFMNEHDFLVLSRTDPGDAVPQRRRSKEASTSRQAQESEVEETSSSAEESTPSEEQSPPPSPSVSPSPPPSPSRSPVRSPSPVRVRRGGSRRRRQVESPVTEPPVSEPIVSEPPLPQRPVSEPPVHQPPVTELPARESSVPSTRQTHRSPPPIIQETSDHESCGEEDL